MVLDGKNCFGYKGNDGWFIRHDCVENYNKEIRKLTIKERYL